MGVLESTGIESAASFVRDTGSSIATNAAREPELVTFQSYFARLVIVVLLPGRRGRRGILFMLGRGACREAALVEFQQAIAANL